ncbi:transketolase family protein [Kitasatospora sp. NPDC088783]|uniref:transketolase family protein n=1 Tax=Kitasatospora sp. NPDC088783 TaxID=3364077 RepID=UPI0038129596
MTERNPGTGPAAGMRPAVARALADLGDRLPDLVALAADGRALATAFAARHPDRFIDVGIAEGNLMGVAAGLARAGQRVVVCGMAPFLVRRAAEQLRIDICRPGLDVTVLGVGGGLGYGTLGATHHVPEDLGALSAMPHTRVYCPADVHAADWAVRDAVLGGGPRYVRLGAREDPVVHAADTPFSFDRPGVFDFDGPDSTSAPGDPDAPGDAVVVAAGRTVAEALRAAEAVRPHGRRVRVLGLTAVFPFPREALLAAVSGASTVVTVEEHHVLGGLATQTALALAGRWHGTFRFLAVDERPAPVLDQAGLFHFYGIDAASIARALVEPPPTPE